MSETTNRAAQSATENILQRNVFDARRGSLVSTLSTSEGRGLQLFHPSMKSVMVNPNS